MSFLYVLLILVMIFFKTQAKQLLTALVQLITALANAIVNGMKS